MLLVCLAIPAAAPPRSDNAPTLDIKVDGAGYLPGFPKHALLVAPGSTAEITFELRRVRDNKSILQGTWTPKQFDADSGDQVQSADFSSWNETGDYYLSVPGIGRSFPFRIAPDVYRRAYYLAARSFYGQRCGTSVNLGREFPRLYHETCHHNGLFDKSSGKDGAHPSAKGWHDAGDYGRYVVNSGISTATLLWAVELWGRGKMQKVALQLPESGNGAPDLLNEARWNIDWMLTMQDTDGGVWHKQTSAHFCGFVLPEKDDLPSLVIGSGSDPYKTSCATADFAAVTAIAARAFSPYDRGYADRCLAAAKHAWQWLNDHPNVTFHNPSGIATGEYGDNDCSDERLWAAAELARSTDDAAFDTYFSEHYDEFLNRISADDPPSQTNTAALALWTYALGKGRNQVAVKAIEARSLRVASEITQRVLVQPYRTSMTRKNYIWGSNGVAANYGLQLLIANQFQNNRQYVETATENLHYLLGRNPFSLSYLTHVGAHSVEHIHHRPSAAAGSPWPGLLSGGPNAQRQDPEMQRLIPLDTPPARAFLDLQGSYASNEVAINWNAPLVFVLAGLLPE